MQVKKYIDKSSLDNRAKEIFIQKILNQSKKAGINISEDLIKEIAANKWDDKNSEKLHNGLVSIISKEIGIKEQKIEEKLKKYSTEKNIPITDWRLFQLYVHLRDDKMLNDKITNLYS
ncbi:MAG: hypothetical protein ACFFCV_11790 [Promethearchaeota archaeon]